MRAVTVPVKLAPGADGQIAEVSVVNGHIWMTFLGPRGGRQYTLPLSIGGAIELGRHLAQAAFAAKAALAATEGDSR